MSVFRKNKTFSSKLKEDIKDIDYKISDNKDLERKKIGFGHKDKKVGKNKNYKVDNISYKDEKTISDDKKQNYNEEEYSKIKYEDFLFDDLNQIKENNSEENINPEKIEDWSKIKRKTYIKKDMKDKPVFLEDTGEKIGVVFDSIYDDNQNLIGYKIKDTESDSVLSFPLDQFDEDKRGLVFIPNWYTKGIKSIEKLEFKDRICPELNWLLKDKTISEEELYNIFIKHDDEVSNYIDEAVALSELLNGRLNILERERLTLKEDLMDLTEKRLIKDIDRREFSEIVMNHRKKVNVLDLNIKKSKDLIKRLEETSFGILSKERCLRFEKKEWDDIKNKNTKNETNLSEIQYKTRYKDSILKIDELLEENKLLKSAIEKNIEDPYKNKYNDLKKDYDKLQDDYGELKLAVEKLLEKYEM